MTERAKSQGTRWLLWASTSAGLALLAFNIALQQRNAKLVASLEKFEQSRGPQPGSVIPEIVGERPSGEPASVRFGSKTLILVLSGVCKVCSENWPAWRELVNSLPGGTPVLYADVTDTINDKYMARFMVPAAEVITRIDLSTKWRYNLRETPQTVVVAAGGKVERAWIGKLTTQDIRDVRSAF
jgi:hypothetical protein